MVKIDVNKIELALLKAGISTRKAKTVAGCLAGQDFSEDKKEKKKKETFIDLTEVEKKTDDDQEVN